MTTISTISHIQLSDIDIPEDRARALDIVGAEALAAIIKEQGLTNPITVRLIGDRYWLVTGLHRLEAYRLNGEETIPARQSSATSDDEARLEEVMENLGRNELNALDRCHHLHALKQVWQKLHPEERRGGDQKSEKSKVQSLHFDPDSPEVFGFAETVAEKIGLSRRSIFAAVAIWTDLSPYSRTRLAGTVLARKQSELKLLSAQNEAIQKKVIDLVVLDEYPPQSVQEALDYLDKKVSVKGAEKKFLAFVETFKSLADEALDRLLMAEEERIIASLKRRGRI